MNVVGFIWFVANLLVAGALIRFIELMFPGTAVSTALGVVY